MAKQIRRCVFETNSSSTHSISIMNGLTFFDEETMEKWEDGELYITGNPVYGNCVFVTEKEALKIRKKMYDTKGSIGCGEICMTYDEFKKDMKSFNCWNDGNAEIHQYTTKNNETIYTILVSTGETYEE